MAKLIIGASADYSGLSLFNIDTIEFTRRADATFQSIQFGSNRIEDDVRVTENGCHVYTTAPKTVAEIEEVMRHD